MKNKYIIGNWLGIILILFTLKFFNILKGTFQSTTFLLALSFLLTLVITTLEKITRENIEHNELHYENLDGIRYFGSILIIVLHLRPFVGTLDSLDFVINYVLGRVCVPLFFFITSYFIAKKEENSPEYIKKYVRSIIPVYLIWSVVYIPVLISFLKPYFPQMLEYLNLVPTILKIPVILISVPFGLVIVLFYSGAYYHLWYFPALLLSLLILKAWKKKHSLSTLLIVSFILILLGSTETYYGILPTTLQQIVSYYFHIFVTTRNFLFFGLFYVVFGYLVGKKEFEVPKKLVLKTSFWLCVLVLEAIFIKRINRINSNILLSCIPLVYYLFFLLIHSKPLYRRKRVFPLRNLYKYYYLIHPLIIFLFQQFLFNWNQSLAENSFLEVLLILGITHIGATFLLWIKSKFPRLIL